MFLKELNCVYWIPGPAQVSNLLLSRPLLLAASDLEVPIQSTPHPRKKGTPEKCPGSLASPPCSATLQSMLPEGSLGRWLCDPWLSRTVGPFAGN